MGIGYVQGGTRPPPDRPGRGRGGELYSECLSRIPKIEHRTSNIERPGKATQSDIKATPRPPQGLLIGTA